MLVLLIYSMRFGSSSFSSYGHRDLAQKHCSFDILLIIVGGSLTASFVALLVRAANICVVLDGV